MNRIICIVFALCLLPLNMAAQKKNKVDVNALQRKADSLETVCWKNDVIIKDLQSQISLLNEKVGDQEKKLHDAAAMETLSAKIDELTTALKNIEQKPYEIVDSDSQSFSCDRLIIRQGVLFGYADRSGQVVIPAIYDYVYSFNNNYAIVSLSEKWGVIDKNGNIVINCEYEDVAFFGTKAFRVKKNGLWGIVTANNGLEILPIKFGGIGNLSTNDNGIQRATIVSANDNYGVIDENGKIILELAYPCVSIKSDRIEYKTKQDKWMICDLYGKNRRVDPNFD